MEQSDISIYRNIYDDLRQVTGGFFAQNRIQLSERLLLGIGLRFDYRNVDREMNLATSHLVIFHQRLI